MQTAFALSPPLEIRTWQITTQVVTFETDTRLVAVSADTTTEVGVSLVEHVTIRKSVIVTLRPTTTDATRRSQQFIQTVPATPVQPAGLPTPAADFPRLRRVLCQCRPPAW